MTFSSPYRSSSLPEAILKTVAFFDISDQCLNLEEIHRFLFGFSASIEEVSQSVFSLVCDGKLEGRRGFFFFPGRGVLVDQHEVSLRMNRQLWEKVHSFRFLFRLVPFVKMIAVCNRLAFGHARRQSDIDLFVVAKSGRLFFVRTIFAFFLQIFGVRLHDDKTKGRFCLSFLVSEDSLNFEDIAEKPVDVYLAYWAASLRPIVDLDQTHREFLTVNQWYHNAVSLPLLDAPFHTRSLSQRFFEWVFGGIVGDFCEKRLCAFQMKRALKKWNTLERPHGTIIREDMLKFHYPDKRREIAQQWMKSF